MEVVESETSTASRNPSPSLPEGASTVAGEGETATQMEQDASALLSNKITTEPSAASSRNGESVMEEVSAWKYNFLNI